MKMKKRGDELWNNQIITRKKGCFCGGNERGRLSCTLTEIMPRLQVGFTNKIEDQFRFKGQFYSTSARHSNSPGSPDSLPVRYEAHLLLSGVRRTLQLTCLL